MCSTYRFFVNAIGKNIKLWSLVHSYSHSISAMHKILNIPQFKISRSNKSLFEFS